MLRALEIELVAHVFLAAVFTLWLARRLGLSGAVALMAAAGYQLGFFFASQAEHIGFIETGCWLPLAWLSVILLAEKPTLPRFYAAEPVADIDAAGGVCACGTGGLYRCRTVRHSARNPAAVRP
jgi:hypothetical protein